MRSAAAHSIQALQARLAPAEQLSTAEQSNHALAEDDMDDDMLLAIRLSLESHDSELAAAPADPRRTSAPACLQRDHPPGPGPAHGYAAQPRPQSHSPYGERAAASTGAALMMTQAWPAGGLHAPGRTQEPAAAAAAGAKGGVDSDDIPEEFLCPITVRCSAADSLPPHSRARRLSTLSPLCHSTLPPSPPCLALQSVVFLSLFCPS